VLKTAPLSKSAVSRVVSTLKTGLDTWLRQSLAALEPVMLYLDALALRMRSGGKVVSVPVLAVVGVPHARRAIIGTQETRPGLSGWSPTGIGHKGQPECRIEPRSGVGPAHSTDDAAEGNEARRGKGPA
jgi:Transposase, Mutator family